MAGRPRMSLPALAIAVAAFPLAALAQATGPSGESSPEPAALATRGASGATAASAVVRAEIAQLERDVAMLGRLVETQARLATAAGADPGLAWAQRRPLAECLDSPLAPVCDLLPGLFVQPGEGDGRSARAGTTVRTPRPALEATR